jgi:hypothetical protein
MCFYCEICSLKKKETSQSDFSVECIAEVAKQATPKLLDENSLSISV